MVVNLKCLLRLLHFFPSVYIIIASIVILGSFFTICISFQCFELVDPLLLSFLVELFVLGVLVLEHTLSVLTKVEGNLG